VPNAGEQRCLERIRGLRADGISYSGIANELNASSVPSKTGGTWHAFAVQKILMRNATA
jgi:hypothetical protein